MTKQYENQISYFNDFLEEVKKYTKNIHNLNAGATRKSIEETEVKLGMKLPKRYFEFLLLHNGGELFAIPTGTVLAEVFNVENSQRIKGIAYLDESFMEKRRLPNMKNQYLIIADYSYGDLICLDMSRCDGIEAVVVKWNHEIGYVDEEWETLIDWLMEEMEVGGMIVDYEGNDID